MAANSIEDNFYKWAEEEVGDAFRNSGGFETEGENPNRILKSSDGSVLAEIYGTERPLQDVILDYLPCQSGPSPDWTIRLPRSRGHDLIYGFSDDDYGYIISGIEDAIREFEEDF